MTHIPSETETWALQSELDSLLRERASLEAAQAPSAAPLALQAQNIKLRQEAGMLADLVPQYVPYSGPLPASIEEFNALHPAHRKQIAAEQGPEYAATLDFLSKAQAIVNDQAAKAGRVAEILKDSPVKSREEWDALTPRARKRALQSMNNDQRNALCGVVPTRDPQDL